MNKKISITTAVLLIATAVILSSASTFYLLNSRMKESGKAFTRKEELVSKLIKVDDIVRETYIGQISNEKLSNGILSGYMESIGDRYGLYLDRANYRAMNTALSGSFEGIGIKIDQAADKNGLYIASVMKNSPALNAGILPGDVIIKVSGEKVADIGAYTAMNNLVGKEGTVANFTILRNGQEIEQSVTRAVFDKVTVEELTLINNEFGLIRIYEFDSKTPKALEKQLKLAYDNGVSGIIFDLRNNPGGELDSVLECLNQLMPKGNLITIKYKAGILDKNGAPKQPQIYSCEGENEMQIPATILVNKNTASAAELFSADMKDAGKAVLIGQTTFGKQVGQTTFPLGDETAVKLTTFTYLPRGEAIFNEKGITPTYEIPIAEEKISKLNELAIDDDDQLVKAINVLNEQVKGK